MLGLGANLAKGGASLLTFVKDNLKLYLDFKSNKSDTLKFPSEGSTSFNGSSDYVDISNTFQSVFQSAFTITAWIKPDDGQPSGINALFGSDSTGDQDRFRVMLKTDGKIGLLYKSNNNNAGTIDANTTSAVFSDGATDWTHIAVTLSQSGGTVTGIIYVNGIAVAGTFSGSQTMADFATTTNFAIGGANRAGSLTQYFDGKMTNVALWSRELEPEEVQSIMNKSYSQLKGVEKTSLVSWWALDSQSNGVVQPHDGETLGSNLVDNNTSSGWFDNSDGSTITNITNGVSIADDSGFSDIGYFRDSSILSTDLTVGKLYKVQVDAYHNGVTTVELRIRDGASNQLINLTASNTTYIRYIIAQSATGASIRTNNHASGSIAYLTNLSVKEVTSNTGLVTGATTTTSVYGGNAPILPRAVDVAKEGQADAIGNGSASFNGSTDHVDIDKTHILGSNPFTITAWARNTSHGGNYKGVVSMGGSVNNTSTYIGIVPNNQWGFGTYGVINQGINEVSVINQWEHLAVTNDGTNIKMYFNGILKNSQSVGALSISDSGTFIGRIANNTSYPFDGDVAQVGIWQGALTQAQIQSVMESTSYSKIPADVKSTLGSEIASNNFGGWTLNGWTDNGDETASANNSSGGNQDLTLNYSFTASTLYKVTATFSGISGNFYYSMDGTGGLDKTITTNGKQILYVKTSGSGASSFFIRSSNGSSATISNVSIKEVTNDIVAYYPLDGSSSANGVTQDVTTGEVLGSEIMSDGNFDSGISDFTNNDTGWVYRDNALGIVDGSATTAIFARANKSSGTIVAGGLYKVQFTVVEESGGNLRVRVGAGSFTYIYNSGTYIKYITAGSSTAEALNFYAEGNWQGYIDNVSVKQVTSNTGVLK